MLGVGSSDLAWLGWGQTIRARKGRREGGKELLAAPAPASAPAKQMQMQILVRHGNQDGGRRRVDEWEGDLIRLSTHPSCCCAARAREDDTNRRAEPECAVRPLFF